MPGHYDVNGHRSCSLRHIFGIVHLKPQQYAISIWPVVRVEVASELRYQLVTRI